MPLTPDQFAEKVKSKYPQYKDVDNLELSQKIVAKYPDYASQVSFDSPTTSQIDSQIREALKSGDMAAVRGLSATKKSEEAKMPAIPEGKQEAGLLPIDEEQKRKAISEHPILGRIFTSDLFRKAAGVAGETVAEAGEQFQEDEKEKGFLGAAAETVGEEAAGVATGIPKATGETVDALTRLGEIVGKSALSPIDTIKNISEKGFIEGLPERGLITEQTKKLADVMNSLTDFIQDSTGVDRESAFVKTGEILSPTILEGAALIKGAQLAPKVAKTGAEIVETGAKKIAKTADELRQARQAKLASTADELAGKIIQGKTKDIEKARKALSAIDTKDVKTFKDLSERLDENISVLSNKVDERLSQDTNIFRPGDISTKTKVGDKLVSQNYVEDAINQLTEVFNKANKKVESERMAQLLDKFNTEGLSLKEMNDIARIHGSEVRGAFSATGEPSTSVTKQAFENTRKGVKESIRGKMPDETTRVLDQQIASAINTRNLTEKMVEGVNKLQQKIQKRGIGEQIGRAAVNTLNTISFGGLKGAVAAAVPRGMGFKTLNALDLEEQLPKFLKALKKAEAANTPKSIDSALKPIINSGIFESVN